MRSLWITNKFPPDMGGVQQYVFHTVLHMKSANIILCRRSDEKHSKSVDALLSSNGHLIYRSNIFPDDLGIFSIIKHPLIFLRFCRFVDSLIRKEQISAIIFGHVSFYYLFSFLFLKLFSHELFFLIFHGEDIPVIKLKSSSLFRWLILKSRRICNSRFTLNRLNNFLGQDLECFVAYPGVEDKYFFNDENIASAKARYDIQGEKVLYTVGRLDKRKGHDLVIRALPEIIRKFPDVIYLIAGTGPNLDSLKKDVEEYGLKDFVRFLGFVPEDEITDLHKAGDIFVMPNRILDDGDTEGFGIVFLEASASGKPVVGGRAGGAVEAVEDGVTGYIVDPYEPNELVEKVTYLLANPDKAEAMGKEGKKKAWNRFRWPVLAEKFENELKRIFC